MGAVFEVLGTGNGHIEKTYAVLKYSLFRKERLICMCLSASLHEPASNKLPGVWIPSVFPPWIRHAGSFTVVDSTH